MLSEKELVNNGTAITAEKGANKIKTIGKKHVFVESQLFTFFQHLKKYYYLQPTSFNTT